MPGSSKHHGSQHQHARHGLHRRAAYIENFGGNESLELATDWPVSEPGEGEVLVRVAAAGLNPVDWKIREGFLSRAFPHHFPLVLGWEFAGEVAAVGYAARRFDVGDKVWGFARRPDVHHGTFTDYLCIPESYVVRAPATLSVEEAAAVPLAGLTAYQALFDAGGLKEGQDVLILGASGGVGHFATQLAAKVGKARRAIGVASAKHHDFLRFLGATHVVDYHDSHAYERVVMEETTGGQGVDLIVDCFGDPALRESLAAARPGGGTTVVSIASDLSSQVAARAHISFHSVNVAPHARELETLGALLDEGTIRPIVHKVWPFDQVKAALDAQREGGHVGKLVLSMG